MEGTFEETHEGLIKANTKLEEKEKDMKEKEEDLSTLSRRVILLEDEVLKAVNTLNSKAMTAEVEIEELSRQEREAKAMWMDSERKYDEINRRVGVMEEELRKAVERVDNAEKRTSEIDDELRVVGENMIHLEKAEEKALGREEKYKEQIDNILQRLKMADARAEYGEMNITKLNQRIDSIEDDIIREKIKIEGLAGELSDTFNDMMTKY